MSTRDKHEPEDLNGHTSQNEAGPGRQRHKQHDGRKPRPDRLGAAEGDAR